MARTGRPRIEIDWEAVDALCALQCTQEEIASNLSISVDTLERATRREKKQSFAEYFGTKRRVGFVSLRRKQLELAEAGNVTMLIWLGKQYLGQKDKPDEDKPEEAAQPQVDLSILTDEELKQWGQILEKLVAHSADLSGEKPPHSALDTRSFARKCLSSSH